MRNKDNKHISVGIDPELHYKLFYVSSYEGRSGNGLILHLIQQCVQQFEQENGEITLPESLSQKRM